MLRIKNHLLPLVSGLVVAATLPVAAQIRFSNSTKIAYRQNQKDVNFKGGSYDIQMTDGSVSTISFCDDPNYFPPGTYPGRCSPGTSGFLSSGSINGATIQRPYLVITSLTPAYVIEPFKPQYVTLNAAPASTLPRPSAGFKDDSATVYYNLNTTSIAEFKISRYFNSSNYDKSQRDKFQSQIVPGVYNYVFPAFVRPGEDFVFRPAAIAATIYPMVEGYQVINNTPQGVKFTSVNNDRWNKDGFIELSYLRPNVIKWQGMNPANVFAAVDSLYFSLRALVDNSNPENSPLVQKESIFPAFDNGGESQVLLRNPYQTQFTIPPIFPSGTRAMVELRLQRNFQTGAVTYDLSNRRFQIPVIVVNRYTDYVDIDLSQTKQQDLLSDPDMDGYNNLNEWILGSNGDDRGSIPVPPTPAAFQAVNIIGGPTIFGSYFGYNVKVQNDTIPKVTYILQRSLDQGKTWQPFKNGYYLTDGSYSVTPPTDQFGFLLPYNWSVQKVTTIVRGVTYVQYEVRSGIPNTNLNATIPTIQPPGTLGDLYRVKIVLKKKK